jgi:hypothetical protein
MKIDQFTHTKLRSPDFGATHVEKTRAQKYAESSSPLKRTLYKGFRMIQTTAKRISEFFKPTPKTPVSANGLDKGIYFYAPRPGFSVSGFVTGKESELLRSASEPPSYYENKVVKDSVLPPKPPAPPRYSSLKDFARNRTSY